MSDSEDSDSGRSRKDHSSHLSNGEMCGRCGEVHWHCGTLEEVAIETSLSCIRHLAPMRAFHMEVADLYLRLLRDGWGDDTEDSIDWGDLNMDLVIKWIANLVLDGTMDRFSSKAVTKVFGKDVSESMKFAAKRAARVNLAAVTVVSDYLSELLPSLGRKRLNLKGLSLLKKRVAVAQAVNKHCQNVVWDGSRGTLIGTVGPLCRKVLNFDLEEVERLMVKIKTELKQTRMLEDASGFGHASDHESDSPPKAQTREERNNAVDAEAEQASKAIADALMATEEANKRIADAIASGDLDRIQAALDSGQHADSAARKAASKAMRKVRAEKQQAELARQKELERERKAAEEAERAEAAAQAQAKAAKSKPVSVRNSVSLRKEAADVSVGKAKVKPAVKSREPVKKTVQAGSSGAGADWMEARKTGLESVRQTVGAPSGQQLDGSEESRWEALALKYNGFNSQHAAPANVQLAAKLEVTSQRAEWANSWGGGKTDARQTVESSSEWGQDWPVESASSATTVQPVLVSSPDWGGGSDWGGSSSQNVKSLQSNRLGVTAVGLSHNPGVPPGNAHYGEFLTEAEQDFWKPLVGVAELRLGSDEPAGSSWPAATQQLERGENANGGVSSASKAGKGSSRLPQDDDEECVICWDGPRNALYLPCGHARFCYSCAMQTFEAGQPCPICRSGISWVQQIFE